MDDDNPKMVDCASGTPSLDEGLIRSRVALAISAGGGVKQMIEKTGIPRGTMEKYLAETSTPSFVNAVKIAAASGVSLRSIALDIEGDCSIYGGVFGLDASHIVPLHDEKWTDRPNLLHLTSVQHSLINLPAYEVRASAGYGAPVGAESVVEQIAFDRGFLRDLGATPERCTIIWAHGDSMQPTIPDGSILVVDHSQTDVRNGCIYVINVADDLLVKRARRRLDAALELVSDNTLYPPETVSADRLDQLRVVGRVVYFCRTP